MPMPFNECDLFFDSESQIPKRNCQKRIHFFDVSSRQSANLTESPLAASAQRWGWPLCQSICLYFRRRPADEAVLVLIG